MERAHLKSIITVLLAFPAALAWADASDLAPEVFPRSRFGVEPMQVQTGVQKGTASREVTAMDASAATHGESDTVPAIEDGSSSQRSPAGLEVNGAAPSSSKKRESPPVRSLTSEVPEPAMAEPLGSGPDPKTETRGVQEVALIASDLGFFPKTIFVSRDVPVRLFVTGASKNTLCIMMDSFGVRKQVRSQRIEEIPFTPSTPGKYRFYCPVNGMEGNLVVKEFSSDIHSDSNTVTHVSSSDIMGN